MEVSKRSLVGRKRKRACAVAAFTRFVRHCTPFSRYRSTIYIMVSKEAYLAIELDHARGRNLDDSSLVALIAEYFSLDESKPSSDDGDAGSLCFGVYWRMKLLTASGWKVVHVRNTNLPG